jgi:hypothetical protein
MSFGGECDLLAVDRIGRLCTVEVKPRKASSIVWAPAQAIVYAQLFSKWLRHDPDAVQIVDGMIEQRSLLKLVSERPPAPSHLRIGRQVQGQVVLRHPTGAMPRHGDPHMYRNRHASP